MTASPPSAARSGRDRAALGASRAAAAGVAAPRWSRSCCGRGSDRCRRGCSIRRPRRPRWSSIATACRSTRRCRPRPPAACALAADALPPRLVAATIAAEDRRFFGASSASIRWRSLRALRTNLAEGRVVEGASTISQQVAKLLLNRRQPGRHRGVAAKVHEALVALRLEHRFSKRGAAGAVPEPRRLRQSVHRRRARQPAPTSASRRRC